MEQPSVDNDPAEKPEKVGQKKSVQFVDKPSESKSKSQDSFHSEHSNTNGLNLDEEQDPDFKAGEQMKVAQDSILKIAHFLLLHKMTLREVFRGVIYDVKMNDKEFEMISLRHFSDFGQVVFKLAEREVQALSVLISDHFIEDSFVFTFFEDIILQLMSAKRVTTLSNRSVRILIRLNEHLQKKEIAVEDLFNASKVKTKTIRV